MTTLARSPDHALRRWPDAWADGMTTMGMVVSVVGAAVILLERGLWASVGGFLALLLATGLLAGTARIAFGAVDAASRGLGALCRGPAGSRERWNPRSQSASERRPARPVRFLHRDEAPAPAGSEALLALASRAEGTVDVLTRRTLRAGDEVFVCLGESGACGATFPADIRDELRAEHADRCPACGSFGRFATTRIPDRPPPLPAAALRLERTPAFAFRAAS